VSNNWYYLDANRDVKGPVAIDVLIGFIRSSSQGIQSLVWTDSMSDWQPASQRADILQALGVPPSPPSRVSSGAQVEVSSSTLPQESKVLAETKALHPWRRFFARYIDYFSVALLGGVVIGILDNPTLNHLLTNDLVYGMVGLLLLVPIETALLCVCGTTIGKALYNISIERRDGASLGFDDALSRSFGVYIRGFAAGIPIISLVTMYVSYSTLAKTGRTTWDEDFIVRHGTIGIGRILGVICAWTLFAAAIAIGINAK
jgi:RDD family/GYF domain 2